MLKCLLMRRKLYDYLENSLSEIGRIKVKSHLDLCDDCRERLGQIKTIIDLATEKKIPTPPDEFWHNFKVDLDRKLNKLLVPPIALKHKPGYRLKPVFAYAVTLIVMLVMGSYFYGSPRISLSRVAQDQELVNEIATLEEADETFELNHSDDAYIEDINLLYQLS